MLAPHNDRQRNDSAAVRSASLGERARRAAMRACWRVPLHFASISQERLHLHRRQVRFARRHRVVGASAGQGIGGQAAGDGNPT